MNIGETQTQRRVKEAQEVPQEVTQEEEEEDLIIEEVKVKGRVTEESSAHTRKADMSKILIMVNIRGMTGNQTTQG